MPEQTGAVAKLSLGISDQSYQSQMKGCLHFPALPRENIEKLDEILQSRYH